MPKILETSQTESKTWTPNLPFWVKIDGDLSSNSVQLQSRHEDGSDWSVEYTFSGEDKSVIGAGAAERDVVFKLVAQTAGIEAWWGTAVPQSYPR